LVRGAPSALAADEKQSIGGLNEMMYPVTVFLGSVDDDVGGMDMTGRWTACCTIL
jgi:hypothetical protein